MMVGLQRDFNHCIFLGTMQNGEAAMENSMKKSSKISLPYDPEFPLLGADPKDFP